MLNLKTPYSSIQNKLNNILENEPINDINDVFLIIKMSMQYVEKIRMISPKESERLVIQSLEKIIDYQYTHDLRFGLFLKSIIVPTIKIVCQISKQQWGVNNKNPNNNNSLICGLF